MKLVFKASVVHCNAALDGDIIQLIFDTVSDNEDEEENRTTPYVLLSRNFEFSETVTIEWHNGCEYDGGGEIVSLDLHRDRVLIKLDRPMDIAIEFCVSDSQFDELISSLSQILDDKFFSGNSHSDNSLGLDLLFQTKSFPKFIH